MVEQIDLRPTHEIQVRALAETLKGNTEPIKIKKKTISNLFRYDVKKENASKTVDLSAFDKPLYLDERETFLDVQGSATYETIVDKTLIHGFLPTVAPGFKHITVAGAIAGIAIESNCHRYGFVHDGLLEADVLLSDGRIITCSPKNEFRDLFFALPNSYGTLGYILRARIKLRRVKKFVRLETRSLNTPSALVDELELLSRNPNTEYIESLVYRHDRLFLTEGFQTDKVERVASIYGSTVFYKEISRPGTISLTAKDYVFRYDPEWFWVMPDSPVFNLFRVLAPTHLRNSGFYAKYARWREHAAFLPSVVDKTVEKLIQDWQVPWRHAEKLLTFALETIDLNGKPWLLTTIRTPGRASLYPTLKDELYLNVGCYSFAKKIPGKESYYTTKVMDEFCFSHGGTKMLYSSTFMDRSMFEAHYGGLQYDALKRKYDPRSLLPTLYERVMHTK